MKTCDKKYKEGGLDALDFQTINQTYKINWIKYIVFRTIVYHGFGSLI